MATGPLCRIYRTFHYTCVRSTPPDLTHYVQLVSVLSLLSSDTPNLDSPANIDAAVRIVCVFNTFSL